MERHSKPADIAGNLFWGTLILLIGVTWLAINLGLVSESVWDQLWPLWPVLLIIWGLNIILQRTALHILCYLSPLILILAFAYAIASATPDSAGAAWRWTQPLGTLTAPAGPVEDYSYTYDLPANVEEVALTLDLGACRLEVEEAADPDQVSISYQGNVGIPEVDFTLEDGRLEVAGSSPSTRRAGRNTHQEWTVQLPARIPLSLSLDAGAADCRLDLRGFRLRTLDCDSGATKLKALLPPPGDEGYTVNLDTGAATTELRFPAGAPVVVQSDAALSVTNLREAGFRKRDGKWFSEGYAEGVPHARVSLEAGASTLSIQFD